MTSGFRILLPPGWSRVPLVEGTEAAVRRAIQDAVPGSDPAAVRTKMRIWTSLQPAIEQARAAGCRDIYLPLQGMNGLAIPASFVLSEVPATERDCAAVLADLRAGGASSVVEIDGVAGARVDETQRTDDVLDGQSVDTRRITYTVPIPGAGRLLVVAFTTIGDGDPASPFTAILVDLFDAMIETLRFEGAVRTGAEQFAG